MGNALSPEQVRELASQVVHGVPTVLPTEDYDYLMSHGKERDAAVAETLRTLRTRNLQPQPAPKLLEDITTVKASKISSFDAEANIVVTPDKERKNAKVVIGWVGPNLQGLVKGLVETNVAETTLNVRKLTRLATNLEIFDALGGEEGIEVALAHVWQMLEAQGRGQKGILLTNGWANIIPVRINGVSWAVRFRWNASGRDWNVRALPITFPLKWHADVQVVSR